MKSISVPSRFACLKIEDEEFRPVSSKSPRKKQEKPVKKAATTGASNKKSNGQKQAQPSTSTATTSKKKTKGKKDDRQWEEWKKKDEEYVDENFQQDMHSAIVLSKLEFENQKKNAPISVLVTTQDGKMKKKKTKTMSLEQFLDEKSNLVTKEEIEKEEDDEGNFFENMALNAKQQLKKEKVEENRRERSTNIEEVISLAQAQEKLEIEKAKNKKLLQELQEAKQEIVQVKKRNTTLCSMLSQGEMKDKEAILLELERLTTDKDELTEEVGRLHKLLEQERSSSKANLGGGGSLNLESHSAKHKEKNKK